MLSYKQVAEITGFAVQTIYRFVKEGRIPFIRERNRATFTERGIRMWMESDEYKMIKREGRKKKWLGN